MRRQLIQLILTFTLPLLFAWGCASDNPNGHSYEDFVPECTAKLSCADGLNCQFGLCVSGPSDEEITLSFRIVPPAERSELAPFSYRHVPLSTGTHYGNWQFQAQQHVFGSVTIGDAREPLRANLYFTARDGISGTLHTQSWISDSSGSFHLVLPAGAYDVSIIPERDDIPEFKTTIDGLPPATPLNFNLPDPREYVRWSGRLVRLDERLNTRPLPGVRIWAIPTDNSGQSTISTTDEDGNFAVWLHRDVHEFRFQTRGATIVDAESGEELILPTSTFSALQIDLELFPNDAQLIIPGELLIMQHVSEAIAVSGRLLDPNGRPLSGANITAAGRISDIPDAAGITTERATLLSRTNSDSEGYFTLRLLPGISYLITAVGWQADVYLSLAQTLVVQSNAPPPTLEIQMEEFIQRPIEIEIDEAFLNTPVELELTTVMLTTQTTALRDYDLPTDLLSAIHYLEQDESVARYELPLMNGTWTLSFRARNRLSLPTTQVTWELGKRDAQGEAPRFVFPPGVVIAGLITDESGAPVPGAQLEVWLELPNTEPLLLGSSPSWSDGEVRTVIPWQVREPTR